MPGVICHVGQPVDQTCSTLSTKEQKSIPMPSARKKAQLRYEKACGVIRRHFPCIALCAEVTADERKEETTLYIARCRGESSVTGGALRQEGWKKDKDLVYMALHLLAAKPSPLSGYFSISK